MAPQLLPEELLQMLGQIWFCRELQLRQLHALLPPSSPTGLPIAVAYGSRGTGKSSIIASYLSASNLSHTIIRCHECITGRHLLERTVAAVTKSLRSETKDSEIPEYCGRCENLSALTVHLQRLLKGDKRHVVVFDDIDKQREAPPTLLPALARIGENIPGLTILLIVQHPPARFLYQTGVPNIHFSPYNRNQSIQIATSLPNDIFPESRLMDDMDYDIDEHEEDKAWLWPRFCAAVWDSLAQSAARDFVSYRALCDKIWPPFIEPILKGDFGTRDFSRLVVAQRRLFQEENVLLDSIISASPGESTQPKTQTQESLPYYAKWIVVAAYLASFNPARMDALYFMKSTERKRRKKGGGTARSGGGNPSQHRKIPRHLLSPSPFPLDRMLSILHAILPHDLRTTIDIYTQIATLSSLRLLVRAGGIGSSDPLEPGGKWKVGPAVSWEYTQTLARGLDFALMDYLVE